MRLESTDCWHWSLRRGDKWLGPAAVGILPLGLCRHTKEPPLGESKDYNNALRLLAFVWEQR